MRLAGFLLVLWSCVSSHVHAALVLGISAEEPAPTIARLLEERLPPELVVEVRSFAEVTALRQAISNGEVDLAFLEEPQLAIPGVTAVSELYPSVLHVLVREGEPGVDANLGALLASGPVWSGATGGTGHRLALQLAEDYGVDGVELLPDPWTRDPAIYFIFGGLLGNDALSRLSGFKLYSVGDPAAVIGGSIAEGVALRHPNLRAFMLPAEVYPALADVPVLTLSVKTLLVAREDLDADIVYALAVALARLEPAIAAVYPLAGVGELGSSGQAPRALPWHPGAQRYLDRELPSFIERYAEFMGAAATVTIALFSLGVAVYRRRRQARKDRLDIYYQQALSCRAELGAGKDQQAAIADRLRELQEEVFELVIAERIDADAALVAFLSLSNQLLQETGSLPGDPDQPQLRAKPS